MKKLLVTIFLSSLIFCGCEFALNDETAIIFCSERPVIREGFDASTVQTTFDPGQPIYFCIYSKLPFNVNEGRIQILKKDPNSQIFGYTLVQGKDILLEPGKNYYTDSFTTYSDGFYLIRFFTQDNKEQPLAQSSFCITQ